MSGGRRLIVGKARMRWRYIYGFKRGEGSIPLLRRENEGEYLSTWHTGIIPREVNINYDASK